MEAPLSIAWNLVSRLFEAGGRLIVEEALGDEQQRALRDVFARATAVLLVEVARQKPDSRTSLESLGERFAGFFEDRWVAETLVGAALLPESPPYDRLRNRFGELDPSPNSLPIDFEAAMRVLVNEVHRRLREEASKAGSPLHNLVEMSDLAAIRRLLEQSEPVKLPDVATLAERHDLLPPPPALVLGRDEELQAVKHALGVGSPESSSEYGGISRTTVAVRGWPGIGKTTFFAKLCRDREVLEHFPGGVFFLSVGRSAAVYRLAEEVCAVLDIPTSPGATLDALRGRIANALSYRRILLVFDDVWEEQHVAPLLLGGGGSAALVATRRLDVATRLATVPKGSFSLSLLDQEDSIRVLRIRAPGVVAENEEACRRLSRALDGLPLALRVAADLLQVEFEGGFDVSGLLDELAEPARVLDEEVPADVDSEPGDMAEKSLTTVRLLLQKSLERMDADLLRRYARLGVLPPKPLSFGRSTAAEVCCDDSDDPGSGDAESGEKQDRTRDALGALARRGLVESAASMIDPLAFKLDLRLKRPERFWMHAVVAAYALETLQCAEGEAGVRETQQRRMDHYLRVVTAAEEALRQGEENQYFSVFLMELDLPNIRATHEWARSRPLNDRRALHYMSRLLSQGSRALSERLGPEEYLEWTRLAEKAALKIGDAQARKHHRANLGAALVKNGRMEEALPYCEEGLVDARDSKDAQAEAANLANLAIIYRHKRKYEEMLHYASQAEEAAGRADDPNIRAGAIGKQAEFFLSLGRIAEAESRYEDMQTFARNRGELSQNATALLELAKIKRDRPEERDQARRMFEEAAEIFGHLKAYSEYRLAVTGLGVLETEYGSLNAAEDAFERTLKSAVEDDRDEGDRARAKMHLGIVHRYRKTEEGIASAEAEFREALPLATRSKDGDKLGDVLLNLALLLWNDKGDAQGAQATAKDAAEAYANVQSEKESWARGLLEEIGRAGS